MVKQIVARMIVSMFAFLGIFGWAIAALITGNDAIYGAYAGLGLLAILGLMMWAIENV